ncbi:uncharacterized protein B0P05DRAFT_525773 [Gilbertella persicaria]|uniref:Mtf2-like C-terminal domain-containing protein n=1 Tax=Rhizopus stolonifer TaxID=4846 RepID=A0A367KTA3_RHIST|nr:uncharacterized protein B0P05DRAFT_525773 [Gilbertella persicaria]KAI8092311.1 hypothetical protein B0P05DRAFT_525773 [Gilbertella persicaria]RCI05425.1 hypothetical protein CU098_012904 [Rhizopus stolonifer]
MMLGRFRLYSNTARHNTMMAHNKIAIKKTAPFRPFSCSRHNYDKKEPHFWEIETKEKPNDMPFSTQSVQDDTRDFRELLEGLFTTQTPKAVEPVAPLNKSTGSLIEKRLLDMVLKNKQPYKSKSPLPRSAISQIYGKRKQEDDQEELLDIFNTDYRKKSNWDMKHIAEDERIATKQKEVKIIQDILDTKTPSDLLALVQQEINRLDQTYPAYYPRIITTAIEHASRTDPYLALSIFELAKNKSVASYIMGCTTDAYNAMLMLRWESWCDVYGMLDLVEEMTLNGIEYDHRSRQIIKQAVQEVESEGEAGTTGVFWNTDEQRNCNLMKELAGKWLVV